MVEVPEVTNSLNDIKDSLDFWKMLKSYESQSTW